MLYMSLYVFVRLTHS